MIRFMIETSHKGRNLGIGRTNRTDVKAIK